MDIKLKNREKLERLQNEIDRLIQENDSYANDIEYWDTVTRTKLESEIQTYRSILNCQIKLMQNSNLAYETYLNKTTTTTTTSSTESESINSKIKICGKKKFFKFFSISLKTSFQLF